MSKKIRFGIVGSGVIASFHVQALQVMKNVEVIQICDIKEERAKEYGEKFNIAWTTNYDEMLANNNIDIIDIVVPSGLHADLGIKAAQAAKHVIVEKPIDVTLEKADALIDACNKSDVTLAVISQMRYFDSVLKMYDIINSGKLGKILQGDAYIKWFRSNEYYASGGWRGTKKLDGGGAFMNQGVHFVDLLLSVMGNVKTVTGRVKTAARDIEVEDIGMAMLEFDSGAYGIIQASTAIYPGFPARLEINGTKGTLIFEGDDIKLVDIEGEEIYSKDDSKTDGASDPLDIEYVPYIREFEDVINAIEEKRQPIVSGQEARKALEVILAIYKSSEIGKSVKLPFEI